MRIHVSLTSHLISWQWIDMELRSYDLYWTGPGAHWVKNPYPVSISKAKVKRGDHLRAIWLLVVVKGCFKLLRMVLISNVGIGIIRHFDLQRFHEDKQIFFKPTKQLSPTLVCAKRRLTYFQGLKPGPGQFWMTSIPPTSCCQNRHWWGLHILTLRSISIGLHRTNCKFLHILQPGKCFDFSLGDP